MVPADADPGLPRELRDALILLRDHSDNDGFRTLVEDVLAGRCSLVEASGTAAFSDVVFASIAQECATPCADCPGVCAIRRGYSGQ
jgi:hypothetical protein